MKIRAVTEKDATDFARLNNKFNKTQDTGQQIAERVKAFPPGEIALVAEANEEIIGFACLRVTRSLCYGFALAELTELYVEEVYRRRGAGRALIKQAENIAQARGAETLTLLTGGKNISAQEFYRSVGYQILPDLVMSKKLVGK